MESDISRSVSFHLSDQLIEQYPSDKMTKQEIIQKLVLFIQAIQAAHQINYTIIIWRMFRSNGTILKNCILWKQICQSLCDINSNINSSNISSESNSSNSSSESNDNSSDESSDDKQKERIRMAIINNQYCFHPTIGYTDERNQTNEKNYAVFMIRKSFQTNSMMPDILFHKSIRIDQLQELEFQNLNDNNGFLSIQSKKDDLFKDYYFIRNANHNRIVPLRNIIRIGRGGRPRPRGAPIRFVPVRPSAAAAARRRPGRGAAAAMAFRRRQRMIRLQMLQRRRRQQLQRRRRR
jgi:hypothetical protein